MGATVVAELIADTASGAPDIFYLEQRAVAWDIWRRQRRRLDHPWGIAGRGAIHQEYSGISARESRYATRAQVLAHAGRSTQSNPRYATRAQVLPDGRRDHGKGVQQA